MLVNIDLLNETLSQADSGATLGKLIQQHRDDLGISQRQLCNALDISRRSIQRVVNGEAKGVDAEIIGKIAVFFQIETRELIQTHFAEKGLDGDLGRTKRLGFVAREFDLVGLRKLGLTDTAADLEHVEQRVIEFFGYDSIYEYAEELPLALNSQVQHGVSLKMQRLWASAVHKQFSKIDNDNPFRPDQLKSLTKEIRRFTKDEEHGFIRFVRRLYQCGVTVIVESYVANSAVYGATMMVRGRPCIVITNRDKRYDLLWRTLAHEICHAIAHRRQIQEWGYLVNDDESLCADRVEEQAEEFAAEVLVPAEKRRLIQPHIHQDLVVRRKAEEWGVHPSIIYGLYLDRDLKEADPSFRSREYSKFRKKHLISSERAIKSFHHLNTETWKRKTLDETVPLLESTLNPNRRTPGQAMT